MTNETTTAALTLLADNRIFIGNTYTNLCVEQTREGTRLVADPVPAAKLVSPLPQNRYKLLTQEGRDAFFNDFAAMWDAAAANPSFANA